jgi:hypothetical protein
MAYISREQTTRFFRQHTRELVDLFAGTLFSDFADVLQKRFTRNISKKRSSQNEIYLQPAWTLLSSTSGERIAAGNPP